MTFYKTLNPGGAARLGSGLWHLPRRRRPGKWMAPVEGILIPCVNGYHLCRGEADLLEWLGPAIYEAEYRAPKAPPAGHIEDGHRFRGGDPTNGASWEEIS